jgi:hypothetical protein
MRGFGLALAALLLFCNARSSAQIVTLAFVSDPSGITLSGSGTPAVSMNFGNVQAFGGTVPSGVTKSSGGNSFILSTTIGVQVTQIGLSSSYTLTARLQAADLQNTWKLNAVSLSTASTTITTTGTYGTTADSFSLTVPFSATAGTINNTINITAIAN